MKQTAMFGVMVSVALSGCIGEPDVAEATEDLSVFQWTADDPILSNFSGAEPAIGAVGNSGVYVYAQGFTDVDPKYLHWIDFQGQNRPSQNNFQMVPRATTTARPSLVGFNGFIYMFYASGVDQYMARFTPATRSWTDSTRLPFNSIGAPAAVVSGTSLILVRVEPTNKHLVMLTMSASETFSTSTEIFTNPGSGDPCTSRVLPDPGNPTAPIGHFAAAPQLAQTPDTSLGAVALAVNNGCLYLAHRDVASHNILFNTFKFGRWGALRSVTSGAGGPAQTTAAQPAIASSGGVLHMVHIGEVVNGETNGTDLLWTTLANGVWTAPLTIPNRLTRGTPSLASFPSRLAMVRRTPTRRIDDQGTNISYSAFQ